MSSVGSDKLTKAGFSGGGWAGEAWRWALEYNFVPHRCKSSVAAKRLGDGFQLLLSMALRLG